MRGLEKSLGIRKIIPVVAVLVPQAYPLNQFAPTLAGMMKCFFLNTAL
jgi:hypothetical protein